MSVYNNVNLIGRMTKIPTMQTTAKTEKGKGGKDYCNFTLAVQRVGFDGADFIFCTAWGGTAKYLTNDKWISTKDMIAINGEIQTYFDGEKNSVGIRVLNASKVGSAKQDSEEEEKEEVAPIDRVVTNTTETYAEKMARLKRNEGDDYGFEEKKEEDDMPF